MTLSKTRKPGDGVRPRTDFYPTPYGAIRAFLETDELCIFNKAWEPACGDGAICEAVREYHPDMEIVATDLNDHGYGQPEIDFLMETKLLAPAIVTNPPYSLATDFVDHALDLGADYIALLLPISFLGSKKRRRAMSALSRMHVFENRVSMYPKDFDGDKKNNTQILSAWFVWDRSHKGPAEICPRLVFK